MADLDVAEALGALLASYRTPRLSAPARPLYPVARWRYVEWEAALVEAGLSFDDLPFEVVLAEPDVRGVS